MNSKQFTVFPLQNPEEGRASRRAKRADAVANRELILETAQRLFGEQGISQVCMAAIAEAAGIGKGTLYRAFANKGELCLALMDEDMRRFQDRSLQMFREMSSQPALNRLDAFLDKLTHFMDSHAPLLREAQIQGILQHESSAGSDSPHNWLRETIRLLLEQAVHNGEVENLDTPYLADAILAPLNADLFMYQRETLGFEVERISRGVRRLVLDGCRGEPPE